MDGESTTSLPVARKERGTVLEGSHLLTFPLPNLPNKTCRTRRGVGSWRQCKAVSASLHGPAVMVNHVQSSQGGRVWEHGGWMTITMDGFVAS